MLCNRRMINHRKLQAQISSSSHLFVKLEEPVRRRVIKTSINLLPRGKSHHVRYQIKFTGLGICMIQYITALEPSTFQDFKELK